MKNLLNKSDELTRRTFMQHSAASLLGVTATTNLLNAASPNSKGGTAKSVIYLYMSGGVSHLDSFDIKPENSKVRGEASALKTNADGVRVSKFFPNMAKQMNKVAVINSMTTTQGAHAEGEYFMRTGYANRGTIQHPELGAWFSRLLGNNGGTLPANVKIKSSGTLGAGYMPGKYGALPVNNPKEGVRYSVRHKKVSPDMFDKRIDILQKINRDFQQTYRQKDVQSYTDTYNDAIKLMKSKDLDAFDISKEKKNILANYGDNRFGQGCVLARRLVERGVRFVDVHLGGWDHHDDIYNRFQSNAATLDKAMAALIADLSSRGLLDSTLVVLATEFGRTPIINVNRGRDHFPKAYSCLLAGGGIKGGITYGKTDKDGTNIIENKVKVPDFNATIAHAAGIRLDQVITSASGRPFTVADKGKPITALF
ncbi:MAG: DUF1501 domain-containing protein [Lentisphaeraceae bacterium]|nr:DUF1501 domain-containing protein [Lentisphaeraceae bacterium]